MDDTYNDICKTCKQEAYDLDTACDTSLNAAYESAGNVPQKAEGEGEGEGARKKEDTPCRPTTHQ